MDCFHDFCLACDKESTGPYCSQTCRLADLEKANTSAPASPTSPFTLSRVSWGSSASVSNSNYVLSPAYHFTSKPISQSTSQHTDPSRPRSSYFQQSPNRQQPSQSSGSQRCITPSSSRTSLSSTTSDASTTPSRGISQQAYMELQDYYSSFGQAKANTRRPSMK